MQFYTMNKEHFLWDKTISYAERSSWKAGPYLADIMRSGQLSDIERIIIACEDGEIIGFCTLAEKDELPDSFAYTPFIGFIFVDEKARGKRISEKLIYTASEYALSIGYECVYILSGEEGLYEKYGFEKIGIVETIYGTADQLFRKKL